MPYPSALPNIYTNEVLGFNLGGLNGSTDPVSEDCLTLSIWVPRGSRKNLPVLVFSYGGAFMTGRTDVPYQIPAQCVQRSQAHIAVSFNHQGNIFGFPNAGGLSSNQQNLGLLDQRLAIEWVRENIASFSGDPTRIGLWGMSSGAIAIAYYSYSYVHDLIANGLILNSGNEFIDILSRDPAHTNFNCVASHFGCGNLPPLIELHCMRRVNAHAIKDFLRTYFDSGSTPPLIISPIIDNRTVFPNYPAIAQAGHIANLPVLLGSNAEDGIPFVPYPPSPSGLTLADEMTTRFFLCSTLQAAKARLSAGTGPVCRYVYAGNFSNVSPKGWMGAYHGAELPVVFGTHAMFGGNSTELEWRTSWAMQDLWVRFVAKGGRGIGVEG
ncbi:hypothetical protein VTI74DRAFT_6133 [Chaetomium olivicolor]